MASRLVTRSQWGARQPKSVSHSMNPQGITVHYAGPTPWTDSRAVGRRIDRSSPERFRDTTDHDSCPFIVRSSQDYHMDVRGFFDIGYTSLACPHGVRFEGRGKNVRPAAQGTNEGNRISYGVQAMIGQGDPLTDECKRALLDEESRLGVRFRWGHRDWKSTACPGEPAYAWRQAGFPHPSPEEDGFLSALSDKAQRKLAEDAAGAAFLGHANLDLNRKNLKAAMFADKGELMQYTARLREEFGAKDGETVDDVLDRYGRELVELFKAAEE